MDSSKVGPISMRGQQIVGGYNGDAMQNTAEPEPETIFTATTHSLQNHNAQIHDMANNVRRCCDILGGSVPEPTSAQKEGRDVPSHQVPRLRQAMGDQARALEYLHAQLQRLEGILAG